MVRSKKLKKKDEPIVQLRGLRFIVYISLIIYAFFFILSSYYSFLSFRAGFFDVSYLLGAFIILFSLIIIWDIRLCWRLEDKK